MTTDHDKARAAAIELIAADGFSPFLPSPSADDKPEFPDFLAECCWNDGWFDAAGNTPGARYCPQHGETAVEYYRLGFRAGMTAAR